MVYREDQKLEVQQATDIVRLIGEDVALRPKGREFLGLCPFHDDKRPSFHVSPVKQIYKCFSCGAGGDVFSFAMMHHKMTFPEALAHLAERAGIVLNRASGGDRSQSDGGLSERQAIVHANEVALKFFRSQLGHSDIGRTARQYLKQRGISDEMSELFQIGYGPDQWDGLVGEIGRHRLDRATFERAGLIIPRKDSHGVYDRFRHRLVFPILDSLGRPIAFGARRLREEDDPKYLNSPETLLFKKSATLYGLHQAKKPVIDSRVAVVVEGYTDVIACHQAGFRHVIATLGTAFTQDHASVLGRLCEKVVLVFDSDQAGQKAADRAVDVFLSGSVDVAVAVLPSGLDPAQLLDSPEGSQHFEQLLGQSVDALQYKLDRLSEEIGEADTLTARQRVGQRYLSQLVEAGGLRQGDIRTAMVAGRVAQLLGVSQQVVESHIKGLSKVSTTGRLTGRSTRSSHIPASVQSEKDEGNGGTGVASPDLEHRIRALALAERQVIGCLLRRPELFHLSLSDGMALDEALTVAEMVTTHGKELYTAIHERLSNSASLTMTSLLADLALTGRQELANLATDAEADTEARCGDDIERLETLVREAAQSILQHHREQTYQENRRVLFETVSNGSESVNDVDLNRLVEYRRDFPSAVRIARIVGSD